MDVFKQHILYLMLALLLVFSPSSILSEAESEHIDLFFIEEVYLKNRGSKNYPLTDFINAPLFHNCSTQTSSLIEVLFNGSRVEWSDLKIDEDGNPYVELKLPKLMLKPNESIYLRYKVWVRVYKRFIQEPPISINNSGRLSDIPEEIKLKYVGETDLYQIGDEKLRELAFKLMRGEENVLKIVLTIVNWTEHNLMYPLGGLKPPTYPNETLINKVGDCDDQTNLLVTLCRILGIPAFTQIGYIYDESIREEFSAFNERYLVELRSAGGHGWAEVYVPPWGWIPIDLTYFRGARLVNGYIRSKNLLDHIEGSALLTKYVVIIYNVTKSDYVKECREWISDLYEFDLEWRERIEFRLIESCREESMKATSPTLPLLKKYTITKTILQRVTVTTTKTTTLITTVLEKPSMTLEVAVSFILGAVIAAFITILTVKLSRKPILTNS